MTTVFLVGPSQREHAKRLIDQAEHDCVMKIGKAIRSDLQNRKFWPMAADIRRQVPEMAVFTDEQIKLRFLDALGTEMVFLPKLEGSGMFPCGLKSSTLTKAQFAGLVELLYQYGAQHGVLWSEPDNSFGDRE